MWWLPMRSNTSLLCPCSSLLHPCSSLSTTSCCDYFVLARYMVSRISNYLRDYGSTTTNPSIPSWRSGYSRRWLPRWMWRWMCTSLWLQAYLLLLKLSKKRYPSKIFCRQV